MPALRLISTASNGPCPLPQPPVTSRPRSQLEMYFVMRRNPLELWDDRAYTGGDLPGRFMGRPQLLLNRPESIRHVLVDHPENYGRSLSTRRVLRPILGDGLLLAEGKAWRHQRRTIAPALAARSVKLLARHVVTASQATEDALAARAGRLVELLPALQHLALTIAGQSMFSLEMSRFGDELRAMLLRYAARFARPGVLDLLLPPSVPSFADLGRAAFRTEWLRMIDRLIDARTGQPRAAQLGDEPPARDLFDLLAAARDPETGAGFDRSQLRDEVATMILAGHETTGVTLFWACYLAARMPEHAERIAAEASQLDLGPDQAGNAMEALPYTRAFIDETLRLYPPAFLILRQAKGPDRIGEHAIAKASVISIAPWVLHRHRSRWHEPEWFDPARFLPGAPPPQRYSYMPFGAGPRICVGAQFALTEAVIVLARLLRRFRLLLCSSGYVVPLGIVTTQPDRPVRFKLMERR